MVASRSISPTRGFSARLWWRWGTAIRTTIALTRDGHLRLLETKSRGHRKTHSHLLPNVRSAQSQVSDFSESEDLETPKSQIKWKRARKKN